MTRNSPPKWGRGYAMVPGWLAKKQPSANAMLVYIHLALHGWYNGGTATYEQCRPSKRTLALGDPRKGYPGTGLGEQTVARALRELETLGAIVGEPQWDERDGRQLPNVYRLQAGTVEAPWDTEADDEDQGQGEAPASAEDISAPQGGVSQVTPPPGIKGDRGGVSPQVPHPGITGDTQSRKGFDLEPDIKNSSSSASPSGLALVWPSQEEEEQTWEDFAKEILIQRPDWTRAALHETVVALMAAGRSAAMIRAALGLGVLDRRRRKAAGGFHRGTETPKRLLADACPLWGQAADLVIGEAAPELAEATATSAPSRRHDGMCQCAGSGWIEVDPSTHDVQRAGMLRCPGVAA